MWERAEGVPARALRAHAHARCKLGASWTATLRRAGQPQQRDAAWSWCVKGGTGAATSPCSAPTAGSRSSAAPRRAARSAASKVGARMQGSGLRSDGRTAYEVSGGRVRAVAITRLRGAKPLRAAVRAACAARATQAQPAFVAERQRAHGRRPASRSPATGNPTTDAQLTLLCSLLSARRSYPARRGQRNSAFALIRQWGDPVLRERARPVEEFDDAFAQQVSELEEIMRGADGAGLAATQVGSLRRVFVYRLPDDEDDAPARVVVNPEIVEAGEERETALEGCLSLGQARVHVEVERPRDIVIEAVDERGEPLRIEATGLHARILQHEADHLDGVLMLDRTIQGAEARGDPRAQRRRALPPGRPATKDDVDV